MRVRVDRVRSLPLPHGRARPGAPFEGILSEYLIRPETPADHARVDEIEEAAFGRVDEAALVRRLRAAPLETLSLVAERDGALLGHVFFSPVEIDGEGDPPPTVGLAPLAVDPAQQATGVGSALVRTGLRECLAIGWQAVFLLGDPAYYSRFGFELAAPRGFRYESEVFDSAFQVIELVPGALSDCRGWVRYHEAFAGV